jgi:hypothetical protein
MNLYKEYLESLYPNAFCYSDDNGFIVYWLNDKELYIQDMYVREEARVDKGAMRYISDVVEIAKKNECTYMTCNLDLKSKRSKQNLMTFLRYGLSPIKAETEYRLLLMKEI